MLIAVIVFAGCSYKSLPALLGDPILIIKIRGNGLQHSGLFFSFHIYHTLYAKLQS